VAHNLADFDVLVRRDRETIDELAARLGPALSRSSSGS